MQHFIKPATWLFITLVAVGFGTELRAAPSDASIWQAMTGQAISSAKKSSRTIKNRFLSQPNGAKFLVGQRTKNRDKCPNIAGVWTGTCFVSNSDQPAREYSLTIVQDQCMKMQIQSNFSGTKKIQDFPIAGIQTASEDFQAWADNQVPSKNYSLSGINLTDSDSAKILGYVFFESSATLHPLRVESGKYLQIPINNEETFEILTEYLNQNAIYLNWQERKGQRQGLECKFARMPQAERKL